MESMEQGMSGGQSVKHSIRKIDFSVGVTASAPGLSRFCRLQGLIRRFRFGSRQIG